MDKAENARVIPDAAVEAVIAAGHRLGYDGTHVAPFSKEDAQTIIQAALAALDGGTPVTDAMVERFTAKYREIAARCNWGASWPSEGPVRELLSAALDGGEAVPDGALAPVREDTLRLQLEALFEERPADTWGPMEIASRLSPCLEMMVRAAHPPRSEVERAVAEERERIAKMLEARANELSYPGGIVVGSELNDMAAAIRSTP